MSDISITAVSTDGGTQARARLCEDTVSEYAAAMERGDEFPPVVAFYDGTEYWMADGFHRSEAACRANREIAVEVRQGTRRDAILFAVGANDAHGLRRTNADKRRAVETLLRDDEWSQWSNREIARRCRVSNHLVADVKRVLTGNSPSDNEPRTYTTKHGTEATMKTENIGKGRTAAAPENPAAESNEPPAKPSRPRTSMGDTVARNCIKWLKQVTRTDKYRKECFEMMREFMKTREDW